MQLKILSPKSLISNHARRGFTLIESLAVIAIIGILLALGTYVYAQAQAQARDAVRKSDLNQIAQAFSARQLDKTCSDQSAVGVYPGGGLNPSPTLVWTKTSQLASYSDGCGTFSHYLPTIPNDVRSPTFSYYFNLSTTETSGAASVAAVAKHYRLTTSLEHQFAAGSADQLECVRLSHVWIASFGGQPYDCDQHVISRSASGVKIATNYITILPPGGLFATVAHAQVGGGTCHVNPDGTTTCDGGGGGGGTTSCPVGQILVNGVCVPDTGGGGGGTTNPGPYNYYVGQ
ncbi:MAG TPA: type II secretion system protein [Candidatus Saccharimonadales bacterium]|nr:type II secretion system protein [Candidatus Saccharimonadales bacterium]